MDSPDIFEAAWDSSRKHGFEQCRLAAIMQLKEFYPEAEMLGAEKLLALMMRALAFMPGGLRENIQHTRKQGEGENWSGDPQ
jgi:hypothetical protein